MHKKTLSLLLLTAQLLFAKESNQNNLINPTELGNWLAFPYAFVGDSTGAVGGIATIATGVWQPQTILITSVLYGLEEDIVTNGADTTDNFSGLFVSFSNIKIPYSQRLYFSFLSYLSHYPKARLYLDGTNDSSQDDALVTAGDNDLLSFTFKYVLPIGEGLQNPDGLYELKNGFAMNREGYGGGEPFVTGRSSLYVIYDYRAQSVENWKESEPWSLASEMPNWDSSCVRLKFEHDNTDFDLNPSRGYSFSLQYSTNISDQYNMLDWDSLEFKYSHYINLETLSFTKQNVLALNFWTAYSPSWDTNTEFLPGIDNNRAPFWEGPSLGGFTRLRGYESNRFSDKAAIYVAAEYRAILDWNPFDRKGWLSELMPADVDWLQLVGFMEAGRVNDRYNLDLLSDLKYDVGVSLRAMVAEIPVRFDIAYGEEGVNMWVMYRQPFDF